VGSFLPNLNVRNSASDVTSSQDIDLIITEWGIIPPLGATLILQDVFGIVTPEELHEYQTYELEEA